MCRVSEMTHLKAHRRHRCPITATPTRPLTGRPCPAAPLQTCGRRPRTTRAHRRRSATAGRRRPDTAGHPRRRLTGAGHRRTASTGRPTHPRTAGRPRSAGRRAALTADRPRFPTAARPRPRSPTAGRPRRRSWGAGRRPSGALRPPATDAHRHSTTWGGEGHPHPAGRHPRSGARPRRGVPHHPTARGFGPDRRPAWPGRGLTPHTHSKVSDVQHRPGGLALTVGSVLCGIIMSFLLNRLTAAMTNENYSNMPPSS